VAVWGASQSRGAPLLAVGDTYGRILSLLRETPLPDVLGPRCGALVQLVQSNDFRATGADQARQECGPWQRHGRGW
jgi:hypothetical protein